MRVLVTGASGRVGANLVKRPIAVGMHVTAMVMPDDPEAYSDVSHDPRDLPRLLAALGHADVAVGSRYVDGGTIQAWTPLRRGVSRAGSGLARRVLRVPVRDLTGGFEAFRASALVAIDPASVRSQGYAFQVELTYRALKLGLRVHELPIVFHERRHGRSKMSPRIAAEAAWLVPALRLAALGRSPSRRAR